MENDENSNLKPISIVSVIAVIFSLVILSVGTSRFLASKETPMQSPNQLALQTGEVVNLQTNSSNLFGNYRGVVTILNSKITFNSSNLTLNPNGRFVLQADSFNLSSFGSDQLTVNNDYPFLYFDIEGSFVAEESKINLIFDKANYRFDQEEISLNQQESSRIEQVLTTLGVTFEPLKTLPLQVDLTINPNNDFLDLTNSPNGNLLLQIRVRKI